MKQNYGTNELAAVGSGNILEVMDGISSVVVSSIVVLATVGAGS